MSKITATLAVAALTLLSLLLAAGRAAPQDTPRAPTAPRPPAAPRARPRAPAPRKDATRYTPPVDLDPNPNVDVNNRPIPRPVPSPAEIVKRQARANLDTAVLHPAIFRIDEAEAAGLARGSKPRVLSLKDAYTLALIHSQSPEPLKPDDLDPKRLAERAGRLGVGDFDRFAREFLSEPPEDRAVIQNLAAEYFDLLLRLEKIERTTRQLAAMEQIYKIYVDLVKRPAAGVSMEDMDRIDLVMNLSGNALREEKGAYRDALDAFKVRIGLPADADLVPDRSLLAGFHEVLDDDLASWQAKPEHAFEDAYNILQRLPELPALDDRIIPKNVSWYDPAQLEPILRDAVRAASKTRPEADDRRTLRIRGAIRRLLRVREDYDRAKGQHFLALRIYEMGLQQLNAPPEPRPNPPAAGAAPAFAPVGHTRETLRLVELQEQVSAAQVRLIALWITYQADRLRLDHDMGLRPSDSWDDFLDSFRAEPTTPEQKVPPVAPPRRN